MHRYPAPRRPVPRLFSLLILLGCASACAADSMLDTTVTDDLSEAAACVFSFECGATEICSTDGLCVAAPPIEVAYLFEPNIANEYLDTAVPESVAAPVALPSVPQNHSRDAFVDAVLGGMTDVAAVSSPHADLTSLDGDYRELSFAGNTSGPLRDAIAEAWADHVDLRATLHDPNRLLAAVRMLGDIDDAKAVIRPEIDALERELATLDGAVEPAGRGCDYVADHVLHPDYTERATREREAGLQNRFGSWLQCLPAAERALASLERLSLASLQGVELIPLADLRRSYERIVDSYMGSDGIQDGDHQRAFPDAASYIRARELFYAVSLYGNFALQSARTASQLFPFSDLKVPNPLVWIPIGERSIGDLAHEVGNADQAAKLIRAGLVAQNAYLRDLVENPPREIEDIVQVAMLAETFLGERPEFVEVFEQVMAELAARQNVRLWAGVGFGLGCAGGTAALTWVTGPWALALAGSAFVACAVDFGITVSAALRTNRLYQQALTFRYFGLTTTLASAEQLAVLKGQLRLEQVFVVLAFIGAAIDVATIVHHARRALRAVKLARGIEGFTGLFKRQPDRWLPQMLERRFRATFPRDLVGGELVEALRRGRYFPYHNLQHTNQVVDKTIELLTRMADAGLIPRGDVELGRIAAYFHDAVQEIGSVAEPVSDLTLKVTRVAGGESEALSAELAAAWMRANGYVDGDIVRVQRAIVDGTFVGFSPEHTLIPQRYLDDAGAFFGPQGQEDYLPFALSLADFAAHGRGDVGEMLLQTGRVLSEEQPGIVRYYVLGDPTGTFAMSADDAAKAMRGFISFQEPLYSGRRWFALDAWRGLVSDDLSPFVRATYPGFADDTTLAGLRAATAQAQTADAPTLVNMLGIGNP